MLLLFSYRKNPHPNQKLAWFLALFNHLKLCCNDSTFISSALVLAHTCIESLITSQQPSSFPIRDLMLLQEPLEVCTPCQVSGANSQTCLWRHRRWKTVGVLARGLWDAETPSQNSQSAQEKKKPLAKPYYKPGFPAKGMRRLINLFWA